MDNPNITMEDYIKLEGEKALSRGEKFNWQTATYGKMEYCEDEDDCFTNFESKFPAIVLDDTPREVLSWKPTVSPLNDDEIDFRISYDKSDDEDYTIIFDKNSFSYKIISANDLKTDSENDNEKFNLPLFPSPPSPQHIDEFNLKNEISLSECDEKEQNVLYFNDLFPFNVIYLGDLKSDKDNDIDEIDIMQSLGDMSVVPLPNVINTDDGA
ncbi:hypothetical protein Tco_0700198 [Tanacetum coccineum]